MKLLHCADFHLDSAFSGFDREKSDQKRAELRATFVNTMKLARNEGVDLVLIAGDVFDTPFCTSATRKAVFDAIESVGVPVIISPGNHDYYTKSGAYAERNLPSNAYVFSSDELGRFDFDELGVSVVGYAFTSDRYERNPLSHGVPTSDTNINILCAHTDIRSNFSKYAPMSASDIFRAGFVYAALGHIHMPDPPQKIAGCTISYSGFPQGRSFDELGEGGAYIVDIDVESKSVEMKRVPLSTLRYEIEKIDVTGLDRDEDVAIKIGQVCKDKHYGGDVALRAVLVGSVPSDYTISENAILGTSALNELALLQIRNETMPNFDLSHLKTDLTIRGEFYRQLEPLLNSEDEQERARAALALKFGLAALDRREISFGD